MGKEDKLIEKLGRNHGMKVPEGYFDEFTRNLMADLPAYPEAPKPQKLTRWQRIKPYVYMAAMFAGIWCMMKVFHTAAQQNGGLDSMPGDVVAAIQSPEVFDYYSEIASYGEISDFELEQIVSDNYDNIADFEADFDYDLKPEYSGDESKG